MKVSVVHLLTGYFMSGEIIEFRSHHHLRKVRRCRERAVTRGTAGPTRLAQQIARIGGLLDELEDLTRGTQDPPSPILVQARASFEKARRALRPCAQFVESAASEGDGDGDPQPEVDREILERMYRELYPNR
jgi:hypothetical protein